jgi:hypothetical protein
MNNATTDQLLHIVFQEECSIEEKYAAVRELHFRKNWYRKMGDPAIRNLVGYVNG